MALSKQQAPKSHLMAFLAYAASRGYHVGEHPSYGGVNARVHRPGSWHGDGLAADINWRGAGHEMTKLIALIPLAEAYGLGITIARDGTVGSAATHTGHLHVDCGSYSNYGLGAVRAKAATRRPPTPPQNSALAKRVKKMQRAVGATADGIWVGNTQKRLHAVRMASAMFGGKFPYGISDAQSSVKTKRDGVWGPKSRRAHDKAVKRIQKAMGIKRDGVWGPKTDSMYKAIRARARK